MLPEIIKHYNFVIFRTFFLSDFLTRHVFSYTIMYYGFPPHSNDNYAYKYLVDTQKNYSKIDKVDYWSEMVINEKEIDIWTFKISQNDIFI